jgi:hypothetical protein
MKRAVTTRRITKAPSTASETLRELSLTRRRGPGNGLASSCFLGITALLTLASCIQLPRERVATLEDRGYPTCPEGSAAADAVSLSRTLRAGPGMREPSAYETFELRSRDCHVVFTGHEEWAMGASDLEVVFDASLRPLRAYKRSTAPGPQPVATRTDTRIYDLRGEHVELRRRGPLGEIERFVYRAPSPGAIIGPGRGVLSAWLRRAHLAVGGRLREPVLDIRESVEIVRDVTLLRLEDRDDEHLGRRVRVYTIYGREPIYADDDDFVIGDMMGLLPAELVHTPPPVPMTTDGPPRPSAPL